MTVTENIGDHHPIQGMQILGLKAKFIGFRFGFACSGLGVNENDEATHHGI